MKWDLLLDDCNATSQAQPPTKKVEVFYTSVPELPTLGNGNQYCLHHLLLEQHLGMTLNYL